MLTVWPEHKRGMWRDNMNMGKCRPGHASNVIHPVENKQCTIAEVLSHNLIWIHPTKVLRVKRKRRLHKECFKFGQSCGEWRRRIKYVGIFQFVPRKTGCKSNCL